MEEGLTERAAVLAEKFREWELLVELCVRAADLPRLYAYVDKYPSEGVAELAFAQIVDGGGPLVSALVRCERPNVASKLTAWLQASPTRAHLLALQRLTARDYSAAAPALAQLAGEEQDSVNRMTTMASLAKLCILASDEPENQPAETRRKVETCLALSDQHAALPRDIRLHYGLDAEDTKVIPPEEMIQMYIDAEGQNLTEYDYKKALDLTDYVPDIERRDDLRMKVWCASIVRDDWAACRVEAPADELQRRLFFRLIDLVHLM
ncbi:nuclear pore complex protein Nup133-like, partial [Ostrinia furnacalis]